jgi:hypothetical protein
MSWFPEDDFIVDDEPDDDESYPYYDVNDDEEWDTEGGGVIMERVHDWFDWLYGD